MGLKDSSGDFSYALQVDDVTPEGFRSQLGRTDT